MTNITRHISNRFFRLWLAVLLLCCLPVIDFGAQAQTGVRGESLKKECVTKHERQMSLAGTVISAKTGQRIGGSRTFRVHPSNGGKPGRSFGYWSDGYSFQHSKFFDLLRHRIYCDSRVGAASPRLYYVIALRRLLC